MDKEFQKLGFQLLGTSEDSDSLTLVFDYTDSRTSILQLCVNLIDSFGFKYFQYRRIEVINPKSSKKYCEIILSK